MSCKMTHSLLPLYFDGELDQITSRDFELHLDTCQECQEAMSGLDTVRTQLRDSAVRFNAPSALREKIRRQLESSSGSIRQGPTTRTWMALAASWLIVFLVGGGMNSLWHRHTGHVAGGRGLHRSPYRQALVRREDLRIPHRQRLCVTRLPPGRWPYRLRRERTRTRPRLSSRQTSDRCLCFFSAAA